MSSNRKYNMKKHLERKHQGLETPADLRSASYIYNNNGYINRGPQNFDVYLRGKHKSSLPLYNTSFLNNPFDGNILPVLSKHKKVKICIL